MTKEEKIAEAYGEHYYAVKDHMLLNGWVRNKVISRNTTNGMEYDNFGYNLSDVDSIHFSGDGAFSWRLKSLRGIDNNNGWTKSKDQLPEKSGVYEVFWKLEKVKMFFNGSKFIRNEIYKEPSHWRAIIESPDPLY